MGDTCGDGGIVEIQATGAIMVESTVRSSTGGSDCAGGSVFVSALGATFSGEIDVRGGASASEDALTVYAPAGDISFTGTSVVRADGTGQADGSGSDGGTVTLIADAGSIALGASSVTLMGNAPVWHGVYARCARLARRRS